MAAIVIIRYCIVSIKAWHIRIAYMALFVEPVDMKKMRKLFVIYWVHKRDFISESYCLI